MRYMLIFARDITGNIVITTRIYDFENLAYDKMVFEFENILKLKSGIELSNAYLDDDNAWVVMDCGKSKYTWKIVEI